MKLSYRNEKNAKAISAFWGKPLDKKDWFEIKAQSDEDEAEILIYDVIGWPWLETQEFIRALSELNGKDVLVRINSPGGDIVDAIAIYNAFANYKGKVTTRIESLAASSASFIALAGQEVQSYKNGMMMIHEPWTIALGDQYDFRATADVLGKFSINILDIYADNSNIGKRDIKAMMKEETWFTAKEMKAKGLINTIIESEGAKAKFDLSVFANTPEEILGLDDQGGRDLTIREIEHALRDAGASRNFAKAFVAGSNNSDNQRDVENPADGDHANQRDVEIAQNLKALESAIRR